MKITFLGQRIQDLGGFKENPLQNDIKKIIKNTLEGYIGKKCIILTGLNLGIEMWAGHIANELGFPLHVYIPFDSPESKWFGGNLQTYKYLLKKSSKVIQVGTGAFSPKAMLDKEIQMIDHADAIYTFYTANCGAIKYAERNGKTIIDLFPKETDGIFIPI